MTGKGNGIGNPHGAGSPEEKTAGDAAREYSPEAPQVGGFGGYQAMLDQGLRLNRAFIRVSDPLVREAIVNLVVEAAKNQSGEEIPPSDRMLLQDRPAKTEL
jgi:hypothetical protein